MLHFPYCSFIELALKQSVDPLTLPVNPSDHSNAHLKQQYLLLCLVWLFWFKSFYAKQLPGTLEGEDQ